jgi:hypothetical protein
MHDPVFWLRIRDGVVDSEELGSIGRVALDGDRVYSDGDDGVESKRFGEASWRRATGPRGKALLAGSVDAAGRIWTIDETKDGESAWVVVVDRVD